MREDYFHFWHNVSVFFLSEQNGFAHQSQNSSEVPQCHEEVREQGLRAVLFGRRRLVRGVGAQTTERGDVLL